MNQYEMKQRAYQSNLKSRALQVLLYLIDRSNKEQTCFPAVPTIGKELHISISTVKRAMKELVDAGYVTKESRFRAGNRGQTSNLYTLYFPEQEECGNLDKAVSKAEKNKTITKKYEENTQKMIVDENVDCKNQNEIERSGAEQNIQSKKENLIVGSLKKRECKRKLNPILRHNGLTTKVFYSMWTGEEVSLIPPFLEVNKEIYEVYYKGKRKEQYFEQDLKIEHTKINKETGERIVVPSREDSFERLLEAEKQFAEDGNSVEDEVIHTIMVEKLQQTLKMLSEEENTIIQALFYENLSETELAKRLGIARTTLQSRKYKILEKLKEYFHY